MSATNTSQSDRSAFALSQAFEALEGRQMFAITTGLPIENIDHKLWSVAQNVELKKLDHGLIASKSARLDGTKRIQVDIQAGGKLSNLVAKLTRLGAAVTETVDQMRVVQAWVPANRVDDIAALNGVESVRLPDYVHYNVTTAGDGIHNADKVRDQFAALGIDGTGIKVGVISNGVDHKANVGAELPTVTVDPAHPGAGDEGTAMLEIVHDLAPGAQLYFAGITNSAQMIPSINYLVSQGCDVILDDLGFYGESFFTDSAIAQHVAGVVSTNDIVYVTSAGNSAGGNHYQGMYQQGTSFTADGKLHRFGGVGQDSNRIFIAPGETFAAFLQWSDPWSNSNNNYDLFLYQNDDTTFEKLDESKSVQDGGAGDRPLEWVQWTNNTGSTVEAQMWVEKKNTAQVRELELFTIGQNDLQFSTMGDSLIAQEAVGSVLSVAAASAASPNTVEPFSSRGGSSIYTNPAMNQSKSVRQSLDGTAIDGVQTKIGQLGFFSNPFFGTSAASPHAGAIAALVRQVNPNLTAAQVIQTMTTTAVDIDAAGYDTNSGFGRFNALDAVYKAMTPLAPDLAASSDSGFSDSDNLTNDTTPLIQGTAPKASLVRVYVDGVPSAALQLGPAASNFFISTGVLSNGPHSITVRYASAMTVPEANTSFVSPPIAITVDTVAPTVQNKTFHWDDVPYQNLHWSFSEIMPDSVNEQDLVLTNTTTNTSVSSTPLLFGSNGRAFAFPQFTYGALPDGQYTATLAASGVADRAGNPLAADSTLDFFYVGGDANHDGAVDITDLGTLASYWQQEGITSHGDFTYDQLVDISDLGILATNWQVDIFGPPVMVAKSSMPGQSNARLANSIFADSPQDMIALLA